MMNWGDILASQDSRKEEMRRIELAQAGKSDHPVEHMGRPVDIRPRRRPVWRLVWPLPVIHRLRHPFGHRLASE